MHYSQILWDNFVAEFPHVRFGAFRWICLVLDCHFLLSGVQVSSSGYHPAETLLILALSSIICIFYLTARYVNAKMADVIKGKKKKSKQL
jgi:hypothetical protein